MSNILNAIEHLQTLCQAIESDAKQIREAIGKFNDGELTNSNAFVKLSQLGKSLRSWLFTRELAEATATIAAARQVERDEYDSVSPANVLVVAIHPDASFKGWCNLIDQAVFPQVQDIACDLLDIWREDAISKAAVQLNKWLKAHHLEPARLSESCKLTKGVPSTVFSLLEEVTRQRHVSSELKRARRRINEQMLLEDVPGMFAEVESTIRHRDLMDAIRGNSSIRHATKSEAAEIAPKLPHLAGGVLPEWVGEHFRNLQHVLIKALWGKGEVAISSLLGVLYPGERHKEISLSKVVERCNRKLAEKGIEFQIQTRRAEVLVLSRIK